MCSTVPRSFCVNFSSPRSLNQRQRRPVLGLNSGFGSQRQAFGHHLLDDQRDLVMDQLGDFTSANGADIGDLVADGAQNRRDLIQQVGVTAHHNLQARLFGADHPTAYWRVRDSDAALTHEVVDVADQRG